MFWMAYVLQVSYLDFANVKPSFDATPDWEVQKMVLHTTLVLLPPRILLSYYLMYVTLRRFSEKAHPNWKLVLEMTLAIVVCVFLIRLIAVTYVNPFIYNEKVKWSLMTEPTRVIRAFFNLCYVAGLAVAIKLVRSQLVWKEKEKNLIRQKLEAELRFLRAQTNPHFLFNTLNNIYALARKKSELTADAVMRLSKLLRFMLYESGRKRISLADEMKVLEDYVELQKIRYDERLTIYFEGEIDDEKQHIAPLILLPFIENAFKHGASEARLRAYIHIILRLEKGMLYFSVENSKEPGNRPVAGPDGNIGYANVQRQLELIYREYDLKTDNTEERYLVELTINLNSDAEL